MATIAGVDGCKTGWLCIAKDLDTGVIIPDVFGDTGVIPDPSPQDRAGLHIEMWY